MRKHLKNNQNKPHTPAVRKEIAIIGSGPMGMTVAHELLKYGYIPHIYESDNRIGGMSASFNFSGTILERYYHFHCTNDKDYFSLLGELGLEKKIFWSNTRMGYWYKNKIQDWGNPIALLKFDGLSFLSKLRYAWHIFLSIKKKNWIGLDKISAVSWIKKSAGQEVFEVLWSSLFKYKFYHFSNNISAAWIWSRIRRIGLSRYNIFNEKLGYLEGGTQTFLEALKGSIENRKGIFFLNKKITKILISKKELIGLQVGKKKFKYEIIISTIPISYIPKIAPNLGRFYLDKFKSIKNIAVVCVVVKLKKSLSKNFWLNINDRSIPIPGIIEYSNLRPFNDVIVYVPFYLPQSNTMFLDSDLIFKQKTIEYLMKLNDKIKENDFIDIVVNRYKYAQPICSKNFLIKLPPAKTYINGLYIADTSYYYPEDRGISESIKYGKFLVKSFLSTYEI